MIKQNKHFLKPKNSDSVAETGKRTKFLKCKDPNVDLLPITAAK